MFKKISLFIVTFILFFSFLNINTQAKGQPLKENPTFLITFKDSVDKQLIVKYGGDILEEYETLPIVKVKMPTDLANKLSLNESVESIEKDKNISINKALTDGSSVKIPKQIIPWGVKRVNADIVQKAGFTGDGISVAIIDTGIDINHKDLNVAGGISFVDYTTNYNDDNGHGTHIAGIIGALDNKIGIVGVAPNVDLYSVKVLDNNGNGKYSNVIKGIDWAIKNNIKIISMSIGGTEESKAFEKAAKIAYRQGILLVASAGNYGYFNNDSVTIPAKYNSVISVGAINSENQRWEFSSRGKELDLMAPGVDILSTTLGGGYGLNTGSSMAAAYVTGVAALIMENNHTLSNKEITKKLYNNAEYLGESNEYGNGLVNALESIHN
jgi:subtilisin